jgi:hypothetical protein
MSLIDFHHNCAERGASPWAADGEDFFSHDVLDTTKPHIRLFRLIKDEESGAVYGRIECFHHHQAPEYFALSYTWGEQYPLHHVPIGSEGQLLSVRGNLANFLEVFKLRHVGDWIWIDQICIDQDSIQERNHQVQRMAEIYQNASAVIIWIDTTLFSTSRFGKVVLNKHAYWERLWVVQEIMLARRRVIYHGMKTMDWSSFNSVITAEVCSAPYKVYWLCSQLGHQRSSMRDVKSIIRNFSANECADPRDKIYGLQALFEPDERLNVDYSKSVEAVFLDATERLATGTDWTKVESTVRTLGYSMGLLDFDSNMESWVVTSEHILEVQTALDGRHLREEVRDVLRFIRYSSTGLKLIGE